MDFGAFFLEIGHNLVPCRAIEHRVVFLVHCQICLVEFIYISHRQNDVKLGGLRYRCDRNERGLNMPYLLFGELFFVAVNVIAIKGKLNWGKELL